MRIQEPRVFCQSNSGKCSLGHYRFFYSLAFLCLDRGPTELIAQYKQEINTSKGVLQTDKVFLQRNNFLEPVMSAAQPKIKVAVASDRPMTVRY